MVTINAEMPEKLDFLFRPMRYKGAYGGRGSAKSWTFARALLIIGRSKPTRVLCTREIQKSIKDSVHQLLKDQVEKLGLSSFYSVFDTEIKGKNGTRFLFSGLAEHTVDSIKSYEGVDICWIEEAHTVSKRSLDILIPTIRKDGSEIWFSFNPDLETDEIHRRFITNKPDNCICVLMNWRDNPWFNSVLNEERLLCKRTQPDDYDNIWEGKCRPAVEGAIYYKEMQQVEQQGRVCNVPYDPMLRAHVVFDLGWNDAMAIAVVQRNLSEIRIIKYIEDSHRTIDDYSAELKQLRYNWGKVWLPHDGYNGDAKTGKSYADIMRALGWDVPEKDEIAILDVENGIKIARMTFPRVYFDKSGCVYKTVANDGTEIEKGSLIECLKRYRRRVHRETNEPGSPLHDQYSHGSDLFRYICVNADLMNNEPDQQPFHVGIAPSYAAPNW